MWPGVRQISGSPKDRGGRPGCAARSSAATGWWWLWPQGTGGRAAAPAVISELAVAEDLAAGRLIEIAVPELDLRRVLRAIWDATPQPPAGAARDLISHILSRQKRRGTRPGPGDHRH